MPVITIIFRSLRWVFSTISDIFIQQHDSSIDYEYNSSHESMSCIVDQNQFECESDENVCSPRSHNENLLNYETDNVGLQIHIHILFCNLK